MKAKEYYALFQKELAEANAIRSGGEKSPDHQATEKLIQKMCGDLMALAKKRGVDLEHHPKRLEALVEEFNNIWNAMRKLDPQFRRDGFKSLLLNLSKDKAVEEVEEIQRAFRNAPDVKG